MPVQIQIRHGTAAAWTLANPVLALGEMGVETDTSKFKFGDGATPWNGLPYAAAGSGAIDISAGTTSSNRSDWTFADSNGVSFGLNGAGVVTATVQTNYLTTAMASNRGSDFVQATAGFHGTNASGTIASSGISVSVAAPSNNSINISAGTTSSNVTAVTFSNANGVSFGFDGSNVTATVQTNYLTTAMASNRGSDFVQATAVFNGTNASGTIASGAISVSVAAGSNSSWTVSDSATSATVGRLAFTNGNGVTFALSTSNNGNQTISASVKTDYLTTAMASNRGSDFVQATAAFHGTNASGTINSNDISVSVANASNSSWTVSDANTSATVGRLAFTNSNGLTLSLSTSNNGNHTVIGSYTVPTVTNSSWTVSDSATSATVGRLAFTASNGLTLTLSTSNNGNHTVIGSYTVPTVTNSSWTVSDSATSATVGRLAFTASNGLTLTLSTSNNGNHTVIGSYTVPTVTNSSWTVSDSATSATVGRLAFVNSNGVTFGLSTSNNGQQSITATVQTNYLTTAALSSQTLAFSLGGNSGTTNSSQISNGGYVLAGGNNVTINQSNATVSISAGVLNVANSQTTFSNSTLNLLEGGGAITIASSAGGQSFKFSVPQTSSIVGVNGISVSTNGSTISVSGISTYASYWANMPVFQNSTTTMCQSNSFYVFPLTLNNAVSMSYIRLLGSINFTSTTIATTAVNNATGASTAFSETMALNAVFYTAGAGANSRSLQYYTSTSGGMTWAASVSQASTSNATNQSFSQIITFLAEGFSTSTASTQYSVSATNGPISTTQWSNLSGLKFIDIPFASNLSPGIYWLALNRISGTVGGKNMDMNITTYGVSQQNLSFGVVNQATNVSNCPPQIGLGLWTTNTAQTSSSIALASISATTSYMVPMVQFIRQA